MLQGTLTVKPICANLTIDKDWFSRMDPYVIITVGNQKYKTRTANGAGKNPNWTDVFTFRISNETQLLFEIYDRDIGEDDFVGSGYVQLDNVFMRRNVQEWYDVSSHKVSKKIFGKNKPSNENGKNVGKIMLIFEFIPQGFGMQGMMPPMGFNMMQPNTQVPLTPMAQQNPSNTPPIQPLPINTNTQANDYKPILSLNKQLPTHNPQMGLPQMPPQPFTMPQHAPQMPVMPQQNMPGYHFQSPMQYPSPQYPNAISPPMMYPPTQPYPYPVNSMPMNQSPYQNYPYGQYPYPMEPTYYNNPYGSYMPPPY